MSRNLQLLPIVCISHLNFQGTASSLQIKLPPPPAKPELLLPAHVFGDIQSIDAVRVASVQVAGHVRTKQPRESKAVARCMGFRGARPTMDSASSKETWPWIQHRLGYGPTPAVCSGNCMGFFMNYTIVS